MISYSQPATMEGAPATLSRAHAADFKRAASRFASGVTVVTARHAGLAYGITVSAFASFCIDPLQVLVSIFRQNRLHAMILNEQAFAVSILREDPGKTKRRPTP